MDGVFMFGTGCGEVSDEVRARVDSIARRYGAVFVCLPFPEGWRYWFEARDVGAALNAATKADVLDDLLREGIVLP